MNELVSIITEIITRGLEKFGVYYSVYRGVVVENEDPDHLNRVKLQIPQITGDYTLDYWAWPLGIKASKNTGFQWVPQVGEMVWVSFEFGNTRRPVWQFGYRGKDDFMEQRLKSYYKRWIRTPSGHLVILDDEAKTILLESAGGKVMEISDKVSIGSAGESDEPAALANTLVDILSEILDSLNVAKINTAIGTQPFLPDTILKFKTIKEKLGTIKSTSVTIDR